MNPLQPLDHRPALSASAFRLFAVFKGLPPLWTLADPLRVNT
jgi:hypothetical protein